MSIELPTTDWQCNHQFNRKHDRGYLGNVSRVIGSDINPANYSALVRLYLDLDHLWVITRRMVRDLAGLL